MFLLVPAYPGCPGSKAIKRSLLLLLYLQTTTIAQMLSIGGEGAFIVENPTNALRKL